MMKVLNKYKVVSNAFIMVRRYDLSRYTIYGWIKAKLCVLISGDEFLYGYYLHMALKVLIVSPIRFYEYLCTEI